MQPALQDDDGRALAELAAEAVAARLEGRPDPERPDSGPLAAPGATFVTLESHGRLRGCVGTIEPARPLYLDVIRNAHRAMRDPRMPPVTAEERPDLEVKVSVLTQEGGLPADTREHLVAALRPGVDGVLITDGERRATFLPAVWKKLNTPDRFVTALLAKGGWPAQSWPHGLVASRYTAREFSTTMPRPA
ncbi:hypothetical protein Val02_54110 [Virgisporangium aliadipatigenens]|uniref:AMMECR1 domain-containing protein n=1 Tax=Virgisporangium aliadipatigenens TaxID=741659 RepID=A0A8J3YRA1_9ACTN|nr:AmmeMemoRadiSam system protein A [Virgisporangium aliadipatigenens]GIJ48525.1 hypothetical protein Val02_54110 [Virgisporangium aliadipatigenens]